MASASISASSGPETEDGPLGETFHSLRGSISNFHFTRPTTQRFSNCTACSQKVLEEFAQKGFQLLFQTSENPKYLEDLTGLSNLMSDMNFDDVIVCSDEDDFWNRFVKFFQNSQDRENSSLEISWVLSLEYLSSTMIYEKLVDLMGLSFDICAE